MRSVTFVDRLTLDISGDIAQHAISLGDVTGDGDHELVVGTDTGELFVFKGGSGVIWRKCSDLGFISAVGVGDLLSLGHSVIVVVSGCGWLNILDLFGDNDMDTMELDVKPVHTQRIPANVKDVIIGDINGDGSAELVVSLTDRVVRTYKWVSSSSLAISTPPPSPVSSSPTSSTTNNLDSNPGLSHYAGRLVSINKWEFASQIGTVTLNYDTDGSPALLVAQPGGAFMKLKCTSDDESEKVNGDSSVDVDEEESEILSNMSVEYEPLGVNRRRNPNVSAEILGGFHTGDGTGTRYAIVTLDGTIMLVDNCDKPPMESIMWNLQVDHQLMCLSRLDVTRDGLQEVVACSWDGQTYIISQDRQAVRFQFEENVSTFAAGLYSLSPGMTTPALVYVTFNNKIQLYHNIGLERGISLSSLVHWPGMVEEAKEMLDILGVDTTDMRQLQEVYRYCLYGVR